MPIIGILCFVVICITAKTIDHRPIFEGLTIENYESLIAQTPQSTNKPNAKIIKLVTAKIAYKVAEHDYMIIADSVIFLHDGAYLYCDSAHYNDATNSFEAFSNVRMEQGDTLFLYGNYMHYDGNNKLMKVRRNVRMEHIPAKRKNEIVTLFTDSLNYDRNMNVGYYFDGGMIVDAQNELTSFWGQYEPDITIAKFLDSVKLVNQKFTLYSDTLRYNTQTKIATITSPTEIVSDSGVIYTKNGWYNTETDKSLLLDQSTILNTKGDRILRGDSIYYDRTQGFGEVFGNMFMQDTTSKIILIGDYGFYDQKQDKGMATKQAFAIEYSQGDSLFLHADTLRVRTDSVFKEVKAYYGVRFFRTDFQGVCDSMYFNSRDSVLHLYKEPVLWNQGNQIFGDTIDIFLNDSTIDYAHVKKYCFSIEDRDSLHYNQMKGMSLKAFFENKKVKRVLIEGNAESIYYPLEDDGAMIGLNWLEGSFIEIRLNQGKMEKLKVWPTPKGKLTPTLMIEPEQLKLDGFYWFDYLRPLDKKDIFRKVKKKEEDKAPERDSLFDRPE